MKTLVLAAGRSRRVKPIEDKNFLKFFGFTLIEHQIMRLACAGFKDILLMAGAHNKARLQEVAEQQKKLDPTLVIQVLEQENLDEGMAGALKSAQPHVGDEALFVVSSNDVVDVQAYLAMKAALENPADAWLLAVKVKKYFPGGYLKMEGDRIVGIVEKPEPGKEPSEWVNIVLHAYKNSKALFERLKTVSSDRDDRYELALDSLMKGQIFKAVEYTGHWQPIKYPWHVLDLMKYMLSNVCKEGSPLVGIHPSAQIAETAVIKGPVKIEEGVKIYDHAVIQGPAYIGKNSIVANNALVRESIVGDNCVVGFATEIARSFMGDRCWFHTNYVGDSILGDDVSFGAGAICANLRLDEKPIRSDGLETGRNKLGPILGSHIRVGVQSSLMPGVRIGSNTMITSGLVIPESIESGKFVSGKIELQIAENRATLDPSARDRMKSSLPKA